MTPKRQREKTFFQSPPSPVRVGSPWSNVAQDLPGNEATINDVRFWAYRKFGSQYERMNGMATATNYMLRQLETAKEELAVRPTHDQVAKFVDDRLADYLKTPDIENHLKGLSMHVINHHPTFDQTKEFVKDEIDQLKRQQETATKTSLDVLQAQVEAAMITVEQAIESTKRNVKWIEDVETGFHMHVTMSISKLEKSVEELRTLEELRTRAATSSLGPDQQPPGIAPIRDHLECQVRNGHCWHVENLIKDVKEIREEHHGILNAICGRGSKSAERESQGVPDVQAALIEGRVTKLETRANELTECVQKLNDRVYFLGGGPYHNQDTAHPGAHCGGHGAGHHGGHGPGGTGGGPGGPSGGRWPNQEWMPQQMSDEVRIDYNKLFDDKVALSPEYAYHGGDGGDRWRMKTYGYLISKCPILAKILKWAEGCDNKSITKDVWKSENTQEMWMTEINLVKLSDALWGFLNTCLKGEAHTTFENAEELNGFDGWRLVIQEIQKGRSVRKATLRKLVKNPPKISKLEDVSTGMVKYRNLLREYEAVGGKAPDEAEQKSDLLDALPQELRENLMWRAHNKLDETYAQFQSHVQATVNEILFHRGKLPSQVNAVENAQPPNEPRAMNSGDGDKMSEIESMLGAVMKKMGFQPGGKVGTWREPPRKPPGDRPVRCANCGGLNHTKDECTKTKVPLNQRPCHECGQPGHIAANCKNKNSRKAGLVDGDEEQVDFFGCVERQGEFEAPRRPMPRRTTLGDFVPTAVKNTFKVLEQTEDGDESTCSCCAAGGHEMPIVSERKARREATRLSREARRQDDWKRVNQQMVVLNEPNEHLKNEPNDVVGCLVYQNCEDDEEAIMAADEEVEADVAVDSGCVAHVVGPDDVPGTVEIRHPPGKRRRGFKAANGSDMENYGEATVEMVQENGTAIASTFTVTDVTRPLHSTSQICDTGSAACPDGHEVLYTKHGATVVPGGTLSRFLGSVRHVASYPRRGGLYVAKVKFRAPRARTQRQPSPKQPGAQGFGRQGAQR